MIGVGNHGVQIAVAIVNYLVSNRYAIGTAKRTPREIALLCYCEALFRSSSSDACSTTIGFADGDDYFCRLIAA